jgi:hypothetical protein
VARGDLGLAGQVQLAEAAALAAATGLPSGLLVGAGLTLFPFAAYVAWVATRARMAPAAVWAVIVINALWVAESFGLFGFVQPTLLGSAFVVAQALAVAGLAAGEYMGLRREAVHG